VFGGVFKASTDDGPFLTSGPDFTIYQGPFVELGEADLDSSKDRHRCLLTVDHRIFARATPVLTDQFPFWRDLGWRSEDGLVHQATGARVGFPHDRVVTLERLPAGVVRLPFYSSRAAPTALVLDDAQVKPFIERPEQEIIIAPSCSPPSPPSPFLFEPHEAVAARLRIRPQWWVEGSLRCDASAQRPTEERMTLFDALAAADQEAAAAIARASPSAWAVGEEYEEEVLVPEFVMQRFVLGGSPADGERLLARWRVAPQGSKDLPLPVCRALHRGAAGFDRALRSFLADRADQNEGRGEAGGVSPEVQSTEGSSSVEGLALLRIADAMSLPTGTNFPQVPSIARSMPAAAFDPEAWRKVQP
jgi:hypothetical protein